MSTGSSDAHVVGGGESLKQVKNNPYLECVCVCVQFNQGRKACAKDEQEHIWSPKSKHYSKSIQAREKGALRNAHRASLRSSVRMASRGVIKRRATITDLPLYFSGQIQKKYTGEGVS